MGIQLQHIKGFIGTLVLVLLVSGTVSAICHENANVPRDGEKYRRTVDLALDSRLSESPEARKSGGLGERKRNPAATATLKTAPKKRNHWDI